MSDDFQQRGGSPWGTPPGGGSGNGSGRGPTPPDVDKIIKEFQEKIKRFLPGGSSSGGKQAILVLLILAVLALFVSFNRKIMTEGFTGNPWPTGGEADTLPERRRNWAASATGSYLYYSIAVGLALGILFTLFYLLVNLHKQILI